MSLFTVGRSGCDELEHRLTHPRVPLPKPGREFWVRSSDLTEAERERLDLYLEGSRLMAPL